MNPLKTLQVIIVFTVGAEAMYVALRMGKIGEMAIVVPRRISQQWQGNVIMRCAYAPMPLRSAHRLLNLCSLLARGRKFKTAILQRVQSVFVQYFPQRCAQPTVILRFPVPSMV